MGNSRSNTFAFNVFDFAIAEATPFNARHGTILVHRLPQA